MVRTFRKLHGHFIMVSFSIKPGDQTNETESPNLVNETELKGEYQSFSFFYRFSYSIRCSEKFQMEGVINFSKTTRNKRTARVLLSQNLK